MRQRLIQTRSSPHRWAAGLLVAFSLASGGAAAGSSTSPWGSDYFPNVTLTTHEGEAVRFFDDLIKDKVVAINFIYTTCPDVCPLETAQLVRVQDVLGDRLGKDIFFYSITIDPAHDTVPVIKEYRDKFGARWTFLTGAQADIVKLRRKLGLYIEGIQDGSNNHNISMIIGNQKTGRWMKRSPFENPHVIADQLANWLNGWQAPPPIERGYATAPNLRALSAGEKLFRTRCMSCHTIDGSDDTLLGPDLLGVAERRDRDWLVRWLKAPDKMLAEKDPIAVALYEQYNQIAMPNLSLTLVDVSDLLRFMTKESDRLLAAGNVPEKTDATEISKSASGDAVAVMNAWVREPPYPDAPVLAGYMTLVNVGASDKTLVKIESDAFTAVEVHEMTMRDGLMKMAELDQLVVPAGGQIQLEPGGMHLMLKQPKTTLTSGQTVDITLTFDSGVRQDLSLVVAQ